MPRRPRSSRWARRPPDHRSAHEPARWVSRHRCSASRCRRRSSRGRRSAARRPGSPRGGCRPVGRGDGPHLADDVVDEPGPRLGAQRSPRDRRLAHRDRQGVRERREVGGARPRGEVGGICAGQGQPQRHPVAHDVGAGEVVTEPLALGADHRADQGGHAEEEPDLHHPDQLAHEGVVEGDRAGVVAHGAEADASLPRVRPPVRVSSVAGPSPGRPATTVTTAATRPWRRRRPAYAPTIRPRSSRPPSTVTSIRPGDRPARRRRPRGSSSATASPVTSWSARTGRRRRTSLVSWRPARAVRRSARGADAPVPFRGGPRRLRGRAPAAPGGGSTSSQAASRARGPRPTSSSTSTRRSRPT